MSLYQTLDRSFVDYELFRIPGVDRDLRGPRVDLDKPYVACIGAAQTFGRFCQRPFPALLGKSLGIPVLNFAIGGCGPEMYRREPHLGILRRSKLVIAQVLSGRSASNSAWRSNGGDINGVCLSDGRIDRQEPVLRDLLATKSRDYMARIVAETRADFSQHFAGLLDSLGTPSILFWFAKRKPDYVTRYDDLWGMLSDFPHLIDRPTMDAIRPHASDYVECLSSRGLPQRLWSAETAVEGTVRESDGFLYNRYYPSPEMHEDAAKALLGPCRRLLR